MNKKGLDPDGRLINKGVAESLVQQLASSLDGMVKSVTKSKKKDLQRLPLSLSSLQVLAGKAYSYDPQTVLDTAQKLYEKKLPRILVLIVNTCHLINMVIAWLFSAI